MRKEELNPGIQDVTASRARQPTMAAIVKALDVDPGIVHEYLS